MTNSQLFDLANLFVLPFWILMILLPNWEITKKVMESYIPYLVLAGLYIYFISQVFSADPTVVEALANPKLADVARAFAEESVAATGWAHFLVMDLFVGRWIYWQGQEKQIWTFHSLLLCLFAAPVGLLSHLITSAIVDKTKNQIEPDTSTISSSKS